VTIKITQDNNFCRVFELPERYPNGFCFDGGKPVEMLMVDWFYPMPSDVALSVTGKKMPTWDEHKKHLKEFVSKKNYIKKGKAYLIITEFGESMIIGNQSIRR